MIPSFGKILWGVRYIGFKETALVTAAKFAESALSPVLRRKWSRDFAQSRFDKRYQVETLKMVPVDEFDVPAEKKTGAVRYEPTSFLEFGYVISKLSIDHSQFTFVDLGSGKGRALLMAMKFPFRRIVGVEFSRGLHKIAERNLATHGSHTGENRDCLSICADAREFELPLAPMLLYLFNPFDAEVLERVLANVRQSYARHPRPITIVYVNPVHHDLLDQCDFLKLAGTELGGYWRIYETKAKTNGA